VRAGRAALSQLRHRDRCERIRMDRRAARRARDAGVACSCRGRAGDAGGDGSRAMTATAHALPRAALLQMIIGACAISTTSIFVKYANVGPTVSGFYRMAFGGLMLLAWLVATRGWKPLRWSDIGWLLIPAAAFAIDLVMWHRSILYVGPGLATLLGNFQVFLMALAGWLWY